MTPEECATIRSMARCVLPVLVGPSTAVTPAPGARSWLKEEEKAMFCRCFFDVARDALSSLRAKRSNPWRNEASMDCFVAVAPRNDERAQLRLSVSQCD